jgi:hypothetical protein
LIGFLPVV